MEINLLLEIFLVSGVKLLVLLGLLGKFGFFYGTILTVVTVQVYHFLLKKIFNLTPLNGYDKVFVTQNPLFRYQVISMMKFSNFDTEKMKEYIYKNLVQKVPKFRSKIKKKFLEYYWEEVKDEKEVQSRIVVKSKVEDKAALIGYIHEELNNRMDIFKEIPIEIQIIPVGSDKEGAVLFKYDHLFSDGLGMITSISMLTDSFDITVFPTIIQRMKDPKWYEVLYLYLVSPFYLIYTSVVFAFYTYQKCPYKANLKQYSNRSKFLLSKTFKIKDFEKYRKENVVSFNDIMMSAFSITMKNLFDKSEEYKNKKRLIIDLPVGRKKIPHDISEVDVVNQASGVLADIPLIKSKEETKKVAKSIRKFFKPEIQFSLGIGASILGECFHWKLLGYFSHQFVDRFDFLFTNVPGPVKKITFQGMVCDEIFTFPFNGGGLPFITLLSYCGEFRFLVTANENCDWDIKDILVNYEKEIEKFII